MLEKVKQIVKEASSLMLTNDFEIDEKTDLTNIVTSSDVAVQHFLVTELKKLMPEAGFICEEEGLTEYDHEYSWVIDPIDGTTNYSRGIIECSISVALKHNEDIILGVVYSPARREMYWAEKGKGAWCNGKQLHASKRTFSQGLICTAMSTYRKDLAATCNAIIMETFYKCNDFRRFGSAALELCYLAAGQIDLYFEIRLQPWDFAGAKIIVEEAGACLGSFDEPLRYDRPCLVIGANNTANLDELSAIVHRHMDKIPYCD